MEDRMGKMTHGLTKHPLYKVWCSMKERCYRKNDLAFNRYGGSGVTVCDEWKNDFQNFYDWAILTWKRGLQIDKDILCEELNVSPKIYSPQTCKFVTPRENGMASSHVVVSDELAVKIESYLSECHNVMGLRQHAADKFGITKSQLIKFVNSNRCSLSFERGATKKATPELEQHILKLKNERYTFKEIELKVGINWSTCRSIVRRLRKQELER